MLYYFQTSVDGKTWETISGPISRQDAVNQKKDADHHGLSDWDIKTRVIPQKQFLKEK